MGKTVKTSEIKKKYKDKSGTESEITIRYAKVVDRLNAFREDYPRSKICTKSHVLSNGATLIKAYIWKDKNEFISLLGTTSEENILLSADADATAQSDERQLKNEKGFEKLETIAVGRALAFLGYAASGEIASSEEMERYEQWKAEQAAIAIEVACKKLGGAKTMEELRGVFNDLENAVRRSNEIIKVKNEMKIKLSELTSRS